MAENIQYWKQLISNGISLLQEQNNDAAAVLKQAAFDVEHTYHDSWRWGTDYWELVLYLKRGDYTALGDKKEQLEKDIMSALVTLQKGSRDLLSTVSIRPAVEQDMEWKEVLPFQKAAEDAELLICEESYALAFDRICTAFSDYIRHILTKHGVHLKTEDNLPSLITKLHGYYCSHIHPTDAGDRITTILQSTGEIINTIYESKNNNAETHHDGQVIEKREAQLAVSLTNSIVDYIDDVENELL